MLSVGLFAEKVTIPLKETASAQDGLFMGGGWYLLGVQALGGLCYTVWGIACTWVLLFLVDKVLHLRMDEHHEVMGADFSEHNLEEEPLSCDCKCKEVERILNEISVNGIIHRQNVPQTMNMEVI